MTTSTKDKQDSEDKPIKRKKISSSNNSSKKESSTKNRNPNKESSKIVDLTNISSLDNKELVKLAKQNKLLQ